MRQFFTVSSLKALSNSKDYPIDLTIGDGKVVMANPDDKGQAELVADTDGELKIRVDGKYLADALKACGGMVEFKLTSPSSPMLFSSNGYQLVVMPMLTTEAKQAEPEAEAEQADTTEPEAETVEPEAEATEPVKPKPKKAKRSRAKQPVIA